MDNLLLVDIYNRSKKLRIDTDVRRIAVIIELNSDKETNGLEIVRGIYTGKTKVSLQQMMKKAVIVVR